jgi:hypothetical protein
MSVFRKEQNQVHSIARPMTNASTGQMNIHGQLLLDGLGNNHHGGSHD